MCKQQRSVTKCSGTPICLNTEVARRFKEEFDDIEHRWSEGSEQGQVRVEKTVTMSLIKLSTMRKNVVASIEVNLLLMKNVTIKHSDIVAMIVQQSFNGKTLRFIYLSCCSCSKARVQLRLDSNETLLKLTNIDHLLKTMKKTI